MRRVQRQGGARGPHARRTLCTLSVRPRGRVRRWRGPSLTSTRRLHRLPYHSVRRVFPSTAARPAFRWRLPERRRLRAVCLHPSCSRRGRRTLALCREAPHLTHRRARGYPRYPRGPRSGPGYVVPDPHRLTGPIRPTRRHPATSPLSGLYAGPCLGPNASAAHERFRAFAAVPSRHVALIDPGESAGCTRPVPSPATLAFVRWRRTRHSQVPTIRVRWAAFSRLSWFAPLRPVGWLASLDGSDQTRVWPPETCTTGLPTGRSPFPPPAMTTVATGQAPPAGLAPAGTSVSIAAPPTPQMGPYHRSSAPWPRAC